MAKEKSKHALEQQRYRDKHPERIAEQNRAYYSRNREAINSRNRANREKAAGAGQGSILREHRKTLGLSQEKYAERLGITQALLSLWERDKSPVNRELVAAVFPELKFPDA